ncbi:MAG: RimK family alpha-L-glutamate ligase, partial [Desulfurococcaceae archaeon]
RSIYIKIHELDSYIDNGLIRVKRFNEDIDIDGGIIRSLGLYLTIDSFMKRIGVLEALSTFSTIINKPEAIVYTRDKWRSLLKLVRNGISVPDTLLTENPFSAMRFCEKQSVSVYKPLIGSLGLGSTLVNDPDIAYHLTRSLLNIGLPSYYQVFLNKPGYDFRVFVVGNDVIGAMKRVIASGWKTNIAQGARGIGINCSEYSEVCDIAIKATRILDLDYAGVDIAYDNNTNKYYVLEVNAFPQWIGLRTATGVDVAKHIVQYLIDKIKR